MKRRPPALPSYVSRKSRYKRNLSSEFTKKVESAIETFKNARNRSIIKQEGFENFLGIEQRIKDLIFASWDQLGVSDRRIWYVLYTYNVQRKKPDDFRVYWESHMSWAYFSKKMKAREFARLMTWEFPNAFTVIDIIEGHKRHITHHKSPRLRGIR